MTFNNKKTKNRLIIVSGKNDNSRVLNNSSFVVKVLHEVTLDVKMEKLTDKQHIIKTIIIRFFFIFLNLSLRIKISTIEITTKLYPIISSK